MKTLKSYVCGRWHEATSGFATLVNPSTEEPVALPRAGDFLRHVGLYAYRAKTLAELAAQPPVRLESAESLEQLRALWLGIPIHVTTVAEAPGHGVDTAEDLARARAHFQT